MNKSIIYKAKEDKDIQEDLRKLEALQKEFKALEQEPKTDTWSIKDVADTLAKHGLIAEQDPCEDAVSRQAVLDLVNSDWKYEGLETDVASLPSVNLKKIGWIPVSNRLPEENGDYFVTLENGVVEILGYSTTQRTTYPKGFYYISNGFSWRQTINPVIAWMPLPKGYKPQESEVEDGNDSR